MTIAAGFVARDGILLCADSQYTAAEKTYRPKVFAENCGAFTIGFTFSGDEDYAKTAIFDSFDAVTRIPQGSPMLEARKAIRRVIKQVISDYNAAKLADPLQQPAFLVAISSESEKALFSSRETAMPPVESYACLGTGSYLGQYIVPSQLPHPMTLSIRSLVPLSLHMIAAVKRHDAYCGGGANFVVIRGRESRGFYFADPARPDAGFVDYDRLSSQLLLSLGNPNDSDEEFQNKLAAFTKSITELRNSLLLNSDSAYGLLLATLCPSTSQHRESTTGDLLHLPPSQE